MVHETYEIEVDGYTIWVSNNHKHTKNKDLQRRNLFECFLVTGIYYATLLVSADFLKDRSMHTFILDQLMREINTKRLKEMFGVN